MAFGAAGNNGVRRGPDLEEISTEAIGFQALAGESKLQLIRSPWPSNALPPPTASLLSIASKKGLLAAGGPDSVVVASTDAVRQAFNANDGGNTKSFEPQLTLSLGTRISHVSFTANEEFLILSAEDGGGLAAYEVQSLSQGNTQSALELSTSGVALREVLPNPTAERAELVAVVTSNGQLIMANLSTRQFTSGPQGQTLKDGVSCVSWSNKGKQLIAGLANGTCLQMTPEGETKAEIPKPENVEGDQHVSSIDWLENDVFLIVHTPSTPESGLPTLSTYHIVSRARPPGGETTFTYQTLPELSPSMISNRSPPYQFMLRLRDFPPSLTHLIAVASTASVDVSLATKSKIPLSSDLPPEKAVDVFTATVMADDSRRAQLPMTESMTDTSPVGIAIDLSSKEKVQRPLPREEFEESPGPLPAIMVLNNEGVLAAWWLVYAESIRQGTSYPGLAALGNAPNHQTQAQRQSSTTPTPSTPANGQNAFGSMLTPSAPISSPSPSQAPAQFGPNPATAFGAPSGLNQKVPLWSGNATGSQAPSAPFGQPAFPSSNNAANPQQSAAFGASSALGHRSSPWGTPSSGTATTAGGAFGQPAKLGSQASPFASLPGGNTDNKNPSSGANPFAAFANKQAGFNAVPSTPGNKTSVFGQHSTSVPFNAGAGSSGMFGQPEKPAESASVFGTGGFQLNSTFKGDGSAANDGPKPEGDGSALLFGNNFGSRLGETTSKDADMDESEDQAPQQAEGTPFKLASPKLFGQPAEIPSTGSLFGNTRETKNEVNAGQDSKPAGFQFGSVSPRKEEPGGAQAENPSDSPPEDSPKIKEEPLDDGDISPLNDEEAKPPEGYDEAGRDNQTNPETPPGSPPRSPELPVPPESTSKTAFAPGDSSNSSKSSDDVPLPPDFLPTKSKLQDVETATPEKLQLPETSGEDQDTDAEKERDSASGSLDDEGSGVDVAQEISPSSSKESSKITPGSSFGRNSHMTGPEKLFGATQEDDSPPKPSLFGEVGKSSAPIFPLPKPQQSPRSPSPVRLPTALNRLRPESSRSLSAPGPIKPASVLTNESKTQASRPKPQVSAKDLRSREKERLDAERSRLFDQEHQPLSDDEDNEIQKSLADDIEPSTTLENFVAHQDYVGRVEKPGIPGQIEKVFRDINSMIDTLGINTRSLIAFTKAHGIRSNPPRSHREDLEDLDDWHLIDIEDLNNVEDKLFVQLEEDQIEEVPTKLSSIRQMRAEIRQLRLQSHELARSTDLDTGLGGTKGSNQRPLNLDQQTQLKDLRRAFKQFQKLLADAEKGLMQLRKDLAVQGGDRPRNGKPSLRQPTAEAVEKTIRKMTNMIIEKNNDIEQLSSQMSSLQFGPSLTNSQFSNGESRGSRHGTPTRAGASGLGASAKRASTNRSAQRLKSSLREFNPSATSSNGASAPVSGPANFEYIEEVREKSKRRKEVNEAIKQVFGNGDLKVRPLD